MKKTIFFFGIALAALILRLVEYSFFVRNLSLEFYIGAVALLFTALGILGGPAPYALKSHHTESSPQPMHLPSTKTNWIASASASANMK